MTAIRDDELILFHYRDGLEPARTAAIAAALAADAALRARYARLCETLAAADADAPPAADAGLEGRVWRAVERRLAAQTVVPLRRPVPRAAIVWRWAGLAAAAVLVLALGFAAGRRSVVPPPPGQARTGNARVLDAYVAAHLRETEGVLLTALNSDSGELRGGDAELAAALVQSNRLYAAAAARAGNARLADFLRQLEPLLLELANPAHADDIPVRQGLKDYVRRNDVLFQVRATEARLDDRGGRGT